jgi:uncharacterized membrane protein
MAWDGFVRVAFDEIRQVGAGSPQVSRRLRAVLDDLLEVAPPDRRPALERQRTLLGVIADRVNATDADRDAATVPDPSGLGSAVELLAPSSAVRDGSRGE